MVFFSVQTYCESPLYNLGGIGIFLSLFTNILNVEICDEINLIHIHALSGQRMCAVYMPII